MGCPGLLLVWGNRRCSYSETAGLLLGVVLDSGNGFIHAEEQYECLTPYPHSKWAEYHQHNAPDYLSGVTAPAATCGCYHEDPCNEDTYGAYPEYDLNDDRGNHPPEGQEVVHSRLLSAPLVASASSSPSVAAGWVYTLSRHVCQARANRRNPLTCERQSYIIAAVLARASIQDGGARIAPCPARRRRGVDDQRLPTYEAGNEVHRRRTSR